MKIMQWAVVWLCIAGCVCTATGGVAYAQSSGPTAPLFTLTDLENNKVSLADYKDAPALLFFWTTWCPHCRQAMSQLNKEYDSLQASGIALFVIDTGEPASRVRAAVKKLDLRFPVLVDPDMKVSNDYAVMGVPTFILVDKSGKMIATTHSIPRDYKKLLSQ